MTGSTSMLLPATQAVHPLLWWTDADLDAVRLCVGQACSAWVRDWVGGASNGETRVARCHERPASTQEEWAPVGARGESAAWVQVRAGAVEEILHTLFPEAAGHGAATSTQGMAWAVAANAWAALAETLRAAVGLDADPDPAAPDPALFRPWSGSVVISLAVPGRRALAVLLNPASVRVLRDRTGTRAPARPQQAGTALVPLAQALAERKLPLRVELSPCQLDIGSLEGLRVGDIVPLAHSLEAPLLVSTAQDVQVCAGFLGRQGGLKAVELAREPSSEQEAVIDQHTQREV